MTTLTPQEKTLKALYRAFVDADYKQAWWGGYTTPHALEQREYWLKEAKRLWAEYTALRLEEANGQ